MWVYPLPDSSSDSSSDEDFFDYYYDKDDYYSDSEDDGVTSLEKLKSLRELPKGSEEERHEFLMRFHRRVCHWKGELPNLKDIFQPEVMECLLLDVVNYIAKCRDRVAEQIIKFLVKAGYRDELNAEKDGGGDPSSLRTTPIHHAAKRKLFWIISDLFKIYDRFDVNYTDETGLSHFHVACGQYGCEDVVEKFLELGQVDPDLLVPETADSPLHLAVGNKKTTELLLKNGANPNLINKDGLTPLLIICQQKIYWHDNQYADLAEMYLKISEEKNQVVQVDAKDKLGLTSLHWAVVNNSPKTIDVLVDHGADLSSFVFPTAIHFLDALKWKTDFEDAELDEDAEFEKSMSSAVEVMSGLLTVVERLEKRGYELSRDDALTIILVLSRNEFSWDSEELWYDNEDFADKAKKIMVVEEDDPSLSLYDLVKLRPREAAKRVTFRDYNALTEEFESLPEWSRRHCASRLCEMMSRGFYRRWALDSLLKLTGHRLPILCCEMIVEPLTKGDLFCIFLAAKRQSTPC